MSNPRSRFTTWPGSEHRRRRRRRTATERRTSRHRVRKRVIVIDALTERTEASSRSSSITSAGCMVARHARLAGTGAGQRFRGQGGDLQAHGTGTGNGGGHSGHSRTPHGWMCGVVVRTPGAGDAVRWWVGGPGRWYGSVPLHKPSAPCRSPVRLDHHRNWGHWGRWAARCGRPRGAHLSPPRKSAIQAQVAVEDLNFRPVWRGSGHRGCRHPDRFSPPPESALRAPVAVDDCQNWAGWEGFRSLRRLPCG